ncbi:MAG TPA: TonB-dependent receptor [Candidatus Baltobacteraceae bacterium]|nr:TonB-dependent receptor [Candidatus Baltobacteraceae bacterium]
MRKRKFGHAFAAALMLAMFLSQVTWALAGTTGGLGGVVSDASTGAPLAGVKVTAISPSQSATATTDNRGHFILLALAPDTYVISASKQGYDDVSQAGVTVFADSVSQYNVSMKSALKTIARVTSRAAGNLVKPGVTADTYSVNGAGIQAAGALGGGSNLNNAYSAISSVPGVNIPIGGMGWNQAVFIRGNQSFFTSYEYDGVPVNRAFDNYTSSTESNLGLQELQVYTGGGPASNSSAGTSGFINQVIKTGTYPGYGMLSAGIGSDASYHQLKVEAGGASPNRNFSYYVGLSGYNQDFRYLDNSNGASLFNLGNTYDFVPQFSSSLYFAQNVFGFSPGTSERGVWPICNVSSNFNISVPSAVSSLPWWPTAPGLTDNSCFIDDQAAALASNNVSNITDRENVVNFHFGIPRHDGQRDDVQLLWSASAMQQPEYSSPNDSGGPGLYNLAVTGGIAQEFGLQNYCPQTGVFNGSPCTPVAGTTYPSYIDSSNDYNVPFGTVIQSPSGAVMPVGTYLQPSSNANRLADAQLPNDLRDVLHNDIGIVKAQWTHPLSANAYARFFGYTFFSDWTQAGANSAYNCYDYGIGGPNNCTIAANYDLITHTAGGEFQLADQINTKNLLQLTANYTTASISRFNNTGYISDSPAVYGGSPIGYVSYEGGAYQCWNPTTGQPAAQGCNPGSHNAWTGSGYWGTAGAQSNGSLFGYPSGGNYPVAPAGSPAALAGAQWVSLQSGDTYGTFNTVKPKFLFTSITDEFRPTDKLDFNIGARWDRYEYDLAPVTPGTSFYAQVETGFVCQNQQTGSVLTTPLAPGAPPPAPVVYTPTCPAGYVHPKFSATSPSSYILQDLAPRASFTYTLDPGTVIRGEVGRYSEPPLSAAVQYLNSSGNALTVWNAALPLGFNTPFHPIPLMSSMQSDLSIEHQFHGTDITTKLSPFFDWTSGYQQQAFIGPNFVTQVPVGSFRSYGLEFALSKGDFNREGLSGQLAVTYTNAKVRYENTYFGQNQLANVNPAIQQFNSLTKAGGGSPCYTPFNPSTGTPGSPTSCNTAGAILNPYYNMAQQPLLDPTAWYAPGTTGISPTNNPVVNYFDSPLVTSLILNYKHNNWAITPSFQLSEGSAYGGPYDVIGMDPRACLQNSASAGITGNSPNTNPNQCNYLSLQTGNASPIPVAGQLFIPDPQTGSFAKPGQFQNPWIGMLNLQLRYDVSPKVTALVTLANLWHTCFGGSKEPWTTGAYAPGANVCGYAQNPLYVSNFYNGTSPTDTAANGIAAQKWLQQSYLPFFAGSVGSGLPVPFNAYLQLQIRL